MIHTFLDRNQITNIISRLDIGEPKRSILSDFSNLDGSERAILCNFLDTVHNKSTLILGSKTEPYCTEAEMLTDLNYLWEDLSEKEKQFYEENSERVNAC